MPRNLPLPELPQEIIINILSRLPVKSLIQFKCVSKPWLSLISSPKFAKLHLQQMNQNNTLTCRVFMSTFLSFEPEVYSTNSGHHGVAILRGHDRINNVGHLFVGSCNGLICTALEYRHEHLFVFNPTTQQVREIPTPNFTDYNGRHFCGFGYDSKIDDYKIVRGVIYNLTEDGFCVEIFNLKGSSWRAIQSKYWRGDSFGEQSGRVCGLFEGKCVLLNGILHWLNSSDKDIIRFDLVEETFLKAMPLPTDVVYATRFVYATHLMVMVIDECLCVYMRSGTLLAWKMMEYGDNNSWNRVYPIIHYIFYRHFVRFLYVTKNGHLLFDVDRDYLLLYNPEDEELKQIGHATGASSEKIVYIESLVSPNTSG